MLWSFMENLYKKYHEGVLEKYVIVNKTSRFYKIFY